MSNINLNASQESVLKIFSSAEEVYVIPPYQRTYSWGYNDYKQLYDDVTTAFLNNQDYFLGNMVLARGKDSQDRPEVVDGQQRLITLWLIIKVLSLLYPEMSRLNRILESESIKSDSSVCKIDSLVIENNDREILNEILNYELSKVLELYTSYKRYKRKFVNKEQRITVAFIQLYELFSMFFDNLKENSNKKKFIEFFLDKIFLLPIELKDNTVAEANHSALVIFETLNNRGLNLADADIFKAELYRMAAAEKKEMDFLDSWIDIRTSCDELEISLDDLFRYYSHILRAQAGITSPETNLRDFFLNNSISPLKNSRFNMVISDLNLILSAISTLHMILHNNQVEFDEHAKWIQVLYAYTNAYPKYALVCYAYFIGLNPDTRFLNFLKSLVRYYYQTGSAISNVKYETYSINKRTATGIIQNDYSLMSGEASIPTESTGRLTPGFTLLAHYASGRKLITNYYVNKIIVNKDLSEYSITSIELGNPNLSYILENHFISNEDTTGKHIEDRIAVYDKFYLFGHSEMLTSKTHLLELLKARRKCMVAAIADFFEGKV